MAKKETKEQRTADGGDYHRAEAEESPWMKHGKLALIAGGVIIFLVLVTKGGRNKESGYSYAEECVDNLMVGVSQDCGIAIFGYDCDGTLDCQVAHNNIYCAKCGCDNELIGELFEDLPEECESYFE
ncbi:expressed unknown protein [Seminavis robusta]|uniref:Uncharacterized protein n=1 Tax=Seminavis robusta TaxID=568900 RepID=A0A9N8EI33_9STRA|nr:expressed unknown protein [Seminavis robusta]|eukprot:Sro1114_g242820.1 n/a (127) ;mRNA; f:28990-29370